jgi:hypothetical protein
MTILEKLEYVYSPGFENKRAPISWITNKKLTEFFDIKDADEVAQGACGGGGGDGHRIQPTSVPQTSVPQPPRRRVPIPKEEFYERCEEGVDTEGMSDWQLIDSRNKGLSLKQEKRRYKLMKSVYDKRSHIFKAQKKKAVKRSVKNFFL